MDAVERLWGTADLPPGVEGYVRIVRPSSGRTLVLIITAESLPPRCRAAVRRDLLAQTLAKIAECSDLHPEGEKD